MKNQQARMAMIIGNHLHWKKGYNKSKALKTAWAMVKQGQTFTKVAGVTFENRQQIINRLKKYNNSQIQTTLVWEQDNEFDSNAVAIMVGVNGSRQIKVGYLNREAAQMWVNLVKVGLVNAMVSQITGGEGRSLGMNLQLSLGKQNITCLEHWKSVRENWKKAIKIEAASPVRLTASI